MLPRLPVEQVSVQGLRRTFRWYRPERLAARPALVLALHGSGGDGERLRQLTVGAFERMADEHGFLVAYPDGLGAHWKDCRAGAAFRDALRGVDEVAFLREVARRAADLIERPLGAVFAVGFSNGGHLVFRLAAEAPDQYAAFAVLAAQLPVDDEFDCRPSAQPVSMLFVNGTSDPISPWAGGDVRLASGEVRGRVRSVEDTAAHFRKLAGIKGDVEVTRYDDKDGDGTWIEVRRASNDRGHEVVSVVVHGGGHTIPHPAARFPPQIGAVSREADSARLIWEFFARRLSADTGARN